MILVLDQQDVFFDSSETGTNKKRMSSQMCFPKNTMSNLKAYETIRRVRDAEACNELCTDDCEYFNFKDHRIMARRMCYLLKVEGKRRANFYSGPEGCEFE